MNSSNDDWKTALAEVQVRLSADGNQPETANGTTSSATALASLKELGARHPDSALILDYEVTALLNVKPARLQDPDLAITCADREAYLTHRHDPGVLLLLAQAYRSAGQTERAHAVAQEGLGLLPPTSRGLPVSRMRRLLTPEAAYEHNSP